MEQEPTPNGKNTIDSTDSSGNKKMEIEINRYKQLVEALNNPRILAKVIIVVAIIVVLVFCGISMVSLMLKKFYPYKSISTMQSGATIIQNEDTEVIYWLFNSADLWANSGIEVKEGDVITVRASGAFHTAIHHAVEDAQKNNIFRDDWIRPTGGRRYGDPRDKYRMDFRIMPHATDNVLLMQVIPDEHINTGKDWLKPDSYALGYLDGGNNMDKKNGKDTSATSIVIIGEEKRDIRIPHNGVLHFAVNDIVLTERKIEEMRKSVNICDSVFNVNDTTTDTIYFDKGQLKLGTFPFPKDKKELKAIVDYMNTNKALILQQIDTIRGSDTTLLSTQIDALYSISEKKDKTFTAKDTINIRNIITQNLTELDYYKMHQFVDAWFVDNVGSILIAIERKKK